MTKVSQGTKVTSCIGDDNTPVGCAQILIAAPVWVQNKIKGRRAINLKSLKMIVYDEADEIYLQENNCKAIAAINTLCKEQDIKF